MSNTVHQVVIPLFTSAALQLLVAVFVDATSSRYQKINLVMHVTASHFKPGSTVSTGIQVKVT